jgi:hypothetical protein
VRKYKFDYVRIFSFKYSKYKAIFSLKCEQWFGQINWILMVNNNFTFGLGLTPIQVTCSIHSQGSDTRILKHVYAWSRNSRKYGIPLSPSAESYCTSVNIHHFSNKPEARVRANAYYYYYCYYYYYYYYFYYYYYYCCCCCCPLG